MLAALRWRFSADRRPNASIRPNRSPLLVRAASSADCHARGSGLSTARVPTTTGHGLGWSWRLLSSQARENLRTCGRIVGEPLHYTVLVRDGPLRATARRQQALKPPVHGTFLVARREGRLCVVEVALHLRFSLTTGGLPGLRESPKSDRLPGRDGRSAGPVGTCYGHGRPLPREIQRFRRWNGRNPPFLIIMELT